MDQRNSAAASSSGHPNSNPNRSRSPFRVMANRDQSPPRAPGARGSRDPAPVPAAAAAPDVRLRVSNPTGSTRVVTLNNFPPGELSLHTVEARGRVHIEQALAEHLQDAGCCRVKVSITWMVTKGDGEELVPFSMSLNVLQLLESSRSTATSIHVRELLNRIDAQAKAKMEFAETHESKIVFRSIHEVQLLFAPDRRCQQYNHPIAMQPVQGSGQGSGRATLPSGLRQRRCCLNILNQDEYCFR